MHGTADVLAVSEDRLLFRRMKILIADDDDVIRHLLKKFLPSWGFEVVEAHDGDEALAFLSDDKSLRMAILDWQMPGMDGMEIAYRIRNDLRITPFYVIMLTSRGGRLNLIEGMESGVDDYITKPFDKEVLQARLKAGIRSVEQQSYLVRCIRDLQRDKQDLEALLKELPLCAKCRRVRADNGQDWFPLRAVAEAHFPIADEALLCPVCAAEASSGVAFEDSSGTG